MPDFVIIGAQKGGTTFLYHLLTRHPYVEAATTKEIHYFDWYFDKGTGWYRQNFPPPGWRDGRRVLAGEATPYYLFHPPVPERMAQVVPRARLIVLLRNPVDRAYSHYNQQAGHDFEPLSFEEAIEAEGARLRCERDLRFEKEHPGFNRQYFSYLSRGVYVDQLLRWSRFFPARQMLVLKSEDFFERTPRTLERVLDFLDLPGWDPAPSDVPEERNAREYGQKLDPATRRRLEEYFEPHNRRLYEYLGVDLGW